LFERIVEFHDGDQASTWFIFDDCILHHSIYSTSFFHYFVALQYSTGTHSAIAFPSVRPSVRPSHADIVLKRLYIDHHASTLHGTGESSFSHSKDVGELSVESPQQRGQLQVW